MVRFFCVLIGAYNIFILTRLWALASHYFLKPIQVYIPPIGVIFILVLFIFMIVQSVNIIIFKQSSVKIQIVLSSIDPFLRIYAIIMMYSSYPEKFGSLFGLIIVYIIAVSIDIAVILFLRMNIVKSAFANAEEERRVKFSKKT